MSRSTTRTAMHATAAQSTHRAHTFRYVALLAFVAAALTVLPSAAEATVLVPLSLEELTASASTIVIGEAESVMSRPLAGARGAASLDGIETDVDLRVTQMLKGPAGSAASLTLAGGTLGDTRFLATWEPTFRAGERAILFLDDDGRVLGPQGKLTIRDGRVAALDASVSDVLEQVLGAEPLGPMAGERPDKIAVSATLPEAARTGGASLVMPATTATHVNDGFESGSIALPLDLYDGLAGIDWTASTQRSNTGSWSAYCDDTVPAGGPYADDAYSWLWAGPFDLTSASSAFLEFSVWLEQDTGDELSVTFSTGDDDGDGLLDFDGFAYAAGTSSWVDESIDMGNVPVTGEDLIGEPTVYFAFIWKSDGVAASTSEGAYIDDVRMLEDPNVPLITDITPDSGSAGTGTEVTITGTGFGATQGSGAVDFTYDELWGTTIEGDVTSWSDTEITCIIPIVEDVNEYPGAASTGPVTVTNSTGGTSPGYVFNVTFAYGGIKWADSSTGYTFNANTSDTTEEESLFDAATTTWNVASRFEFQDLGAGTGTDYSNNGENEVFWTSTALPSSTLAAAGIWYNGSTIEEIDIGFNDTKLWGDGSAGSYDIQSIAVHELGHWLNLRDLYGSGDSPKIMYGYGSTGSIKRDLSSGDILGIQWIYGNESLDLDVEVSETLAVRGQDLLYTYTLSNNTTVTATGISIDDSRFGTVATAASLVPSASLVATYSHAFSTTGFKSNMVSATATLSGEAVNLNDSVTVTVDDPDVALTVTASEDPAQYGASVDLRYRVRNTGSFPLSNIEIVDAGRGVTEIPGWDLDPGETRTHTVSLDADAPIVSAARVDAEYLGVPASDSAASLTISTYERISGTDRITTAIAASKRAYPSGGSADTVVVASAFSWADALPASGLAGAADGPLLLVQPTSLPSAVRSEITRLGATKVYIAGGEGVISAAVASAIDGMSGVTVERLGGTNRYGTARKIASEMQTLPGVSIDTAFVATGRNFPDALAASSLAAAMPAAILLTEPDALPSDTRAALSSLGPDTVVIAGGTGVVSTSVESALAPYASSVVRRAGTDRYSTARSVVTWGESILAPSGPTGVFLAVGTNYPDALAGGVVAAVANGSWNPLMLTPSSTLSSQVSSYITANPSVGHVGVLGGTGAVSSGVLDSAKALLP